MGSREQCPFVYVSPSKNSYGGGGGGKRREDGTPSQREGKDEGLKKRILLHEKKGTARRGTEPV